MFPVLGREVVESKQRVSILAQAIGGLLVFQRVALDEGVERQFGSNLGFGHPDLLQRCSISPAPCWCTSPSSASSRCTRCRRRNRRSPPRSGIGATRRSGRPLPSASASCSPLSARSP